MKKENCLILCVFGKQGENIFSVSHIFPRDTGYIFTKLFSKDSIRKRLTFSQWFPWKTLCLFLCMYSRKTENMFATFLTNKRVRFILCVFQENRSRVFSAFSLKTVIASLIYLLIYNLSGRQVPAQRVLHRLDWHPSTPISDSLHLRATVA